MQHYGIILLDGKEVVINVYASDNNGAHTLLSHQTRDLTGFPQKSQPEPSEIIEIIAESFFSGMSSNIKEWKICSRNVAESIIRDITTATKFPIENLKLNREQELICLGILSEF
jgi:hypothetical protein